MSSGPAPFPSIPAILLTSNFVAMAPNVINVSRLQGEPAASARLSISSNPFWCISFGFLPSSVLAVCVNDFPRLVDQDGELGFALIA
jgi:hypothetical protein